MIPLTLIADIMLATCTDVALIHRSIAEARNNGQTEAQVIHELRLTMPLDLYPQAARGVYVLYNLPDEEVMPTIQNNYETCIASADTRLREMAADAKERYNW